MREKSIFIIFAVALILRLAFLLTYQDGMALRNNIMTADAKIYIGLANNILSGKGYSSDGINATAERVPLYPIFLSAIFYFSKENFLLVRILQSVISALICVIIYLLGKEIFSNKVGIIAALIGTVYYPFVQMSAYLVTETVSIFLIILSLWWIIKYQETFAARYYIFGGIFLGMAGLSRSTFFGFYPILLIILMLSFSSRQQGLRISFYTLLGIILIISPWVTRNFIQFNKIIPISTRSGFILYQGNNPMAKAASGGWWPVGKEYIIPKEVFQMTEIERNSYLGKQAKNFIISHPGTFMNLFIKKIVNMWRPYYSGISGLSKLVMLMSYIPVILFGLTGMLWSYKKWKKSAVLIFFILYYIFVHAILVSTIRYRWPVMPCFFIFAAFAIDKITQKYKIDSLIR